MYKSNKSWVGHVLEKHLSTYCYTVQLNNTTNYMCVQGGDYTRKYKTKPNSCKKAQQQILISHGLLLQHNIVKGP